VHPGRHPEALGDQLQRGPVAGDRVETPLCEQVAKASQGQQITVRGDGGNQRRLDDDLQTRRQRILGNCCPLPVTIVTVKLAASSALAPRRASKPTPPPGGR